MENKAFNSVIIASIDAGIEAPHKDDLFIVWSCYILGNHKYLIGCKTNYRYYEVTYNSNKEEWYVDIYKNTYNLPIKDKDLEMYQNY